MAIDKRIIKTRRSIKNAFMQLLMEKELNKVSISDIADMALINRSTFYLHYESIADVMQDIEDEIGNGIENRLKGLCSENFKQTLLDLFSSVAERVQTDKTLEGYIFYSTNSQNTIQRVKDIFAEKLLYALFDASAVEQKPELVYTATFVTAGILDIFLKWLHDDSGISINVLMCKVAESLTVLFYNDKNSNL